MVYFIRAVESGRIKIGFTAGDPLLRMADLQTGSPERLCLLGTMPGGEAEELDLHLRFADLRLNGEWFRPGLSLLRYVAFNCPDVVLDRMHGAFVYQVGFVEGLRLAHKLVGRLGDKAAAAFAELIADLTAHGDADLFESREKFTKYVDFALEAFKGCDQ